MYFQPKVSEFGRMERMDLKNDLIHVQPFSYTIPMNLNEKRICKIRAYVIVEEGDSQYKSFSVSLLNCSIPVADTEKSCPPP